MAGHLVGDYIFQSDAVASGKNKHADPRKFGVDWWYWMSAHAAFHGAIVGYITHNTWIGVAEFIVHWLIDYGKCEKWYQLHTDQILHTVSKLVWVVLLFLMS